MEHTPWKPVENHPHWIQDANGTHISDMSTPELVTLVIRCVNSHAAILAALKISEGVIWDNLQMADDLVAEGIFNAKLIKVRAAIALAEENDNENAG